MTHLSAILSLFLCPISLLAENSVKTQWDQLCSASGGHKLSISTIDGKTVQGKCVSTDAITLRLNRGGNVVSVDRATIKQITAKDPHRALASVWAYCFGAILVTTYIAWPLTVVVAPFAVGAGAAASPFAFVLDLLELGSNKNIEITP